MHDCYICHELYELYRKPSAASITELTKNDQQFLVKASGGQLMIMVDDEYGSPIPVLALVVLGVENV